MKAFLLKLIEKDIHINLVDGELSIKFPKKGIDDTILEEIKSEKQNLIAYLSKLNEGSNIDIPLVEEQDSYAVSSSQKRLWVLSQFDGGSVAYNMISRRELYGNYNIETFRKAIKLVIERHEILRTVFKEDQPGSLRQWILPANSFDVNIDYQDLRAFDDKEQRLKQYVEADAFKAFDLENGPLFRAALIHYSDEHYIFHFNLHHIIGDGWSMNVLAADVMALYHSIENNTTSSLQDLKLQYKDYSAWQLAELEKTNFSEHRDYWTNHLSGTLAVLDLPGQKPRPRVKTVNGHTIHTYIAAEDTAKLKAFVEEEGGSIFAGLLTALNTLFYRYTAQQDIIMGTSVASRDHPDLENQIGYYVNALILRSSVDPSESFKSAYAKARGLVMDVFKHKAYPFDNLVEDLKLPRDISRSAIYDVMLTHQNDTGKFKEGDLEITDEINDMGTTPSKFDLEFTFEETGKNISFSLTYNTDLYEMELMSDLMQHFKQLLSSLLTHQETSVGAVNYLTSSEQKELTETFNAYVADYPKETTLLSLFDKQVASSPDAIALVYENQKLTYKELDQLSDQLAHFILNKYEISKGDFIGVQLDRSELFVASILGILKSGGVYVPIDPQYPAERKRYIIDDAGIDLLLTSTDYMFETDYFEGNLFVLDVEFEKGNFDANALKGKVKADDLAYVIYTSGSTGTPKGVVIDQKGIVNTILSQIDIFNLKDCERSLQFASFSFDASISEIFITLLSGKQLYVIGDQKRSSPELLEEYIVEHKIDIATLPPSYLKLMNMEQLKDMKVLVTAGEAPVYDKTMSYLSYGGTFCNAYGPTEVSICGSVFKMTADTQLHDGIIPIGVPLPNAQMYILNEFGSLQPKGVFGEICIGGAGLAKGYLNQPDLTAEKFVPNPFVENELIYKTGDLGRVLPDGNIEFLGRVDDQVKIRGYRVELGEIAYRLESKEDITKAEVLAKANEAGELELIAYIVAEREQMKGELRQFLSTHLPDYMQPAHYVQLNEIPLTISGKVDKKQLSAMSGHELSSGTEYMAPRNSIEEKLIELLSEELKMDARKIGINDNFFDLGMNSISLIRFLGHFNNAYNMDVQPITLFEHTTVNSFISSVFSDTEQMENEEEHDLSENIDDYINLMNE